MKKIYVLGVTAMVLLASCVSKKELTATQAKLKNTQDLLKVIILRLLNQCLEGLRLKCTVVKNLQRLTLEI